MTGTDPSPLSQKHSHLSSFLLRGAKAWNTARGRDFSRAAREGRLQGRWPRHSPTPWHSKAQACRSVTPAAMGGATGRLSVRPAAVGERRGSGKTRWRAWLKLQTQWPRRPPPAAPRRSSACRRSNRCGVRLRQFRYGVPDVLGYPGIDPTPADIRWPLPALSSAVPSPWP